MNDLTTTARPALRPTGRPTPPTDAPTLITEHQLRFATAAATAAPQVRPRRWATVIRSAFVEAVWQLLDGPAEPARRHHPRRCRYLEHALMAREMDRL